MKNKIRYRQQAPANPVQTKQGTFAYSAVNPFGRQQTVQREIVSYRTTDNVDAKACDQFEKELDTATDKAYNHVIAAPDLSRYNDLDGYIGNWNKSFQKIAVDEEASRQMIPAYFGYAVESLATKVYPPDAPTGYDAYLQVTAEGTRPDVVLARGREEVAWYDLTAQKSKGHINKKSAAWENVPHVSEILYPSIIEETLGQMILQKDVSDYEGVDTTRLEMIKEATATYERRKLRRLARIEKNLKPLLNNVRITLNGDDDYRALNPMIYQQGPAMRVLNEFFGLELEITVADIDKDIFQDEQVKDSDSAAKLRKAAPHILAALGLNPGLFGFIGGGIATGTAWMVLNDQQMPSLSEIMERLSKPKIELVPDDNVLMGGQNETGGLKRKNDSPLGKLKKKKN